MEFIELVLPYIQNFFTNNFATISALVLVILKFISSKIKNDKLKKLIDILPEAMESAEIKGGEPSIKMENCIKYVQENIKGLAIGTIKHYVEKNITVSKTINIKEFQENEKSSVSTITSRHKRR